MQAGLNPSSMLTNRPIGAVTGSQQAPRKPAAPEQQPAVQTQQAGEQAPFIEVKEKLQKAIDYYNGVFEPKHLQFKLHEGSGKYFVQLVNEQTKEVIRQTPSVEFLDMVARSKENGGLIVDERV